MLIGLTCSISETVQIRCNFVAVVCGLSTGIEIGELVTWNDRERRLHRYDLSAAFFSSKVVDFGAYYFKQADM